MPGLKATLLESNFNLHLNNSSDGRFQVIALWFRSVKDLDGVGSSGHVHERCVVKIVLKLASVERGAHDDELQVGPVNDEHIMLLDIASKP
jgi:hypothetical protein